MWVEGLGRCATVRPLSNIVLKISKVVFESNLL
jgi:hypothetical protein